ncbi:MAG: hypothetical protein QOH61_1047 [Chloroflexota bacterium]|nr:hypothetical protein [Chloroflexota bacterium]
MTIRGTAQASTSQAASAVGAVSKVARALVTAGSLVALAEDALAAMREALGFEAAVMYMPYVQGRPLLQRVAGDTTTAGGRGSRQELSFDPAAWRFVTEAASPIIFREKASWLLANPFIPEADSWLVFPLTSEKELVGVVIASSQSPISLDPIDLMTLGSVCDLLNAGVQTARLRSAVQRAAVEQERLRFAADLHDGVAQDLALAVRELRLLDSDNPQMAAVGNRDRLRDAVMSANGMVRAGLNDLYGKAHAGDVVETADAVCERFRGRGLDVTLATTGEPHRVGADSVAAVLRVLHEALSNVQKHAGVSSARVEICFEQEHLVLSVTDDGVGIDARAAEDGAHSHFGLEIMRQRATAAGGTLDVASREPGTLVRFEVPMRGGT